MTTFDEAMKRFEALSKQHRDAHAAIVADRRLSDRGRREHLAQLRDHFAKAVESTKAALAASRDQEAKAARAAWERPASASHATQARMAMAEVRPLDDGALHEYVETALIAGDLVAARAAAGVAASRLKAGPRGTVTGPVAAVNAFCAADSSWERAFDSWWSHQTTERSAMLEAMGLATAAASVLDAASSPVRVTENWESGPAPAPSAPAAPTGPVDVYGRPTSSIGPPPTWGRPLPAPAAPALNAAELLDGAAAAVGADTINGSPPAA